MKATQYKAFDRTKIVQELFRQKQTHRSFKNNRIVRDASASTKRMSIMQSQMGEFNGRESQTSLGFSRNSTVNNLSSNHQNTENKFVNQFEDLIDEMKQTFKTSTNLDSKLKLLQHSDLKKNPTSEDTVAVEQLL